MHTPRADARGVVCKSELATRVASEILAPHSERVSNSGEFVSPVTAACYDLGRKRESVNISSEARISGRLRLTARGYLSIFSIRRSISSGVSQTHFPSCHSTAGTPAWQWRARASRTPRARAASTCVLSLMRPPMSLSVLAAIAGLLLNLLPCDVILELRYPGAAPHGDQPGAGDVRVIVQQPTVG